RGGHGAELDALGGVLLDGAGDLLGAEVRGEPLDVEVQLLGEGDEGGLVELGGGPHRAARGEGLGVGGAGGRAGGGEGGGGGAGGVLAVDVHVAPFDAQLAAVHVLAQRGQGVLGPAGAVGALVVGEDDEHDGCVDGPLGQGVLGVAGLGGGEVGA